FRHGWIQESPAGWPASGLSLLGPPDKGDRSFGWINGGPADGAVVGSGLPHTRGGVYGRLRHRVRPAPAGAELHLRHQQAERSWRLAYAGIGLDPKDRL